MAAEKDVCMNMKMESWSMGIVCSLMIGGGSVWGTEIPKEPDEDHLVREDVNIILGLYYREYSLKQDGIVDFKTARQILISEYNEHWNTVVETKEWPLFYWVDEDRDGEFDHYVDQEVQGHHKDIIPYLPVSEP
jgi:hypothetical protein